jgi:hypothetical protein
MGKSITKFLTSLAVAFSSFAAHADFTDLQFGQAQIADSQWNVSSCMNTTTCQIYSKNPGTAYKIPWTNGQLSWSTGDYVKFVATGNVTNPYNAIQYTSAGVQKAVMGTGHIINMGTDYFFFVGNDNNTGQLFSMTQGFANTAGLSWTGTRNPTVSEVNALSVGGSTTPLAAGQTAAPAAPTPNPTAVTSSIITTVTPTSSNSPASEGAAKAVDGTSSSKYLNFDRANAGFTITLNAGKVINGVKFTTANDFVPRDPTKFTLYGSNDGHTWTEITANQSTTLENVSGRYTQTGMITINNTNPYVFYFITFPSIKAIDTYGSVAGCRSAMGTLACDSMQIGEVTYYYDSNNTATSTSTLVGSIANPGTAGATSSMNTSPTVVSTAPGSDIVTTTSTPGSTTTATTVTRGTTATASVTTDTRDRQPKVLNINRNITVTDTTPVTTTVVQTTPVTVTTTTTPVTVTTWSDGTTTTTNGTPVVTVTVTDNVVTTSTTADDVQVTSTDRLYSTRIDQFDRLAEANTRENLALASDPLGRHRVYDSEIKLMGANVNERTVFTVQGSNQNSSVQDGYALTSNRFVLGLAHRLRTDLLIGAQYSQSRIQLGGNASSGLLDKNAINLYSLWTKNDWLVKGDLGYAQNDYNTTHALNELGLSNSARASGNDVWAAVRAYTPAVKGFRLFAGARREHNRRDYAVDAGSELSAVDYAAVNAVNNTTEAGVRLDHYVNDKVNIYAEYAQNNRQISTSKLGLSYLSGPHSSIQIGATQQRQNGQQFNGAVAEVRLLF